MGENLTNDLIRLAYKETSQLETELLYSEIERDAELQLAYYEIKEAGKQLDLLRKSPSTACVDFILNYSKKSNNRMLQTC